jgi:hypothetical protein
MNTIEYPGIDWGRGQTNINRDTGIRYGVIPHHRVGTAWYEDSEPSYVDACPYCGTELPDNFEEFLAQIYPCCGQDVEDGDRDTVEPVSFYIQDETYTAEQQADDSDIFIIKSLYFTYAQFCSPCGPGACYLLNPLEEPVENNRAYCFGHEMFERGVAPYPVYDVETGTLISPEKDPSSEDIRDTFEPYFGVPYQEEQNW